MVNSLNGDKYDSYNKTHQIMAAKFDIAYTFTFDNAFRPGCFLLLGADAYIYKNVLIILP